MNWREFAACRGMNIDIFFLDDNSWGKKRDYTEARAICACCPVRIHCLEDAIESPLDYGIFGGLNPQERRQLARLRRLEERSQSA